MSENEKLLPIESDNFEIDIVDDILEIRHDFRFDYCGWTCESTYLDKDEVENLIKAWNKRHKEPVDSGCDCVVAREKTAGRCELVNWYKSNFTSGLYNLKKFKASNDMNNFCPKCGQSLKPFYDALMEVE